MSEREEIRQLLARMDPGQLQHLIHAEHNARLHEEERAKDHALVGFRLRDEDFEELCQHLTDGGGVSEDMTPSLDGKSLTLILWQAIQHRDQPTFWRELPHLVKAWMSARGLIRQIPGSPGATIISGALPPSPLTAPFPAVPPPAPAKE